MISVHLMKAVSAVVLTGVFLSACSGGGSASSTGGGGWFSGVFGESQRPVEKPIEEWTAEEIFKRGEYDLERGKPKLSAKWFGEVERLYPYSQWAKRALIMQAFSYHKNKEYELSRATAQRFIDTYPADDDAAYAQYLLALSYYDQIDEVGRDQGLTFQALQALRAVIEIYPDTEYAKSAILKFDLAFDHLAAKEMEIGRYYLKRKHYVASINRFRVVVEKFQTTTQVAEALHRLVESYLALGLTDEAQTAGAILGYNFRSTEWYESSYRLLTQSGLEAAPKGDNWLTAIHRQLIQGKWL
ncbi:Beta-barrel assembly machine subunit BamD [Aliiroseovarius crassostreae]|uniref:Outer membrane protein assembly factor BamD n=1 Tax=Aliiroseovarius crassostreae TaxID=154981 RepID=A0A0P7ID42_9RHOB|nr:outer membrane protein assembly factor BamD [Aliiroseovarius crassostreae]KPN61916.1 competence protein ComL [Aliiroseovarius crassostreae]SFU69938.1 Beta-barrel assembly machine subunit BamD [Aliiroseovarius crassostreae]